MKTLYLQGEKKMEEERKVYIGNLEYSVTEDELRKKMEENGLQIKNLKIIKDRFTGKSKGFGFAEFENNNEVQLAIDSLDGQELKGRKLKVSRAHKQRPKFERRERPNRFRR
jgi:RNA recognition motif-containing protein